MTPLGISDYEVGHKDINGFVLGEEGDQGKGFTISYCNIHKTVLHETDTCTLFLVPHADTVVQKCP